MTFDPTQPYKNIDGVNINLTPDELTEYNAAQAAWAAGAQGRILAALAAHRYVVQTGGTTINGIPFLTDPDSQLALMGASILAASNPGYTVQWKTPNGFVTFNAAQITGAYAAGAAFIQKCFDTESTLITNVAQYSDAPTIIAAFDAAMSSQEDL